MNEWLSTAAQPGKTVQSKEVHLWSILLDQPEQLSRCAALLCAEESARAERFYFVRDRHRYTIGRGMLRLIVGHYLGLPPGDLCFTYNPYGKPALAAEQNAGCHFIFFGESFNYPPVHHLSYICIIIHGL